MTARRRIEDTIQKAVVRHLQVHGVPGLLWWHTPNGGRRGNIEAVIFKTLGVRPGVPDLFFVYQGKPYGLELKAPGGYLTPAQRDFGEALKAQGGLWFCAFGLDEALTALRSWGLLRGAMQ